MRFLIVSLMALSLLVGEPAEAAGKKPEKAKTVIQKTEEKENKKEKSQFKDFEEISKDAEHYEGFFDLYQIDEHLYLLIPESRLGEQFLLSAQLAEGFGARGVIGGTMLDWEARMVALERHANKIYLVQKPVRYMADGDPSTANALAFAVGDSVLETAKIIAIKKPKSERQVSAGEAVDTSAPGEEESPADTVDREEGEETLVIDIGGWMLSDLSMVGDLIKSGLSPNPKQKGSASLDKSRSYLQSVKSFPKNINIKVKLTFKPGRPMHFNSVPDNRYLPVSVFYCFSALPEEPMTPREADSRIGLFMTVRKDFSRTDKDDFFLRFVRKWRLEPGEKVGELYRPKKPIVYYLDHSIPEEFRGPLKAGVEAWNEAFEKAGFKDAIRAEMLPDSADPEDIRYATLRWSTSDRPSYGAIGPSVVDPRTGEILDADILFESNLVLGFHQAWRQINPEKSLEQIFNEFEGESERVLMGGELASFASEFNAQGNLLRSVLLMRGTIVPGQPVPKEFIDEALKWVSMHEVGHTLGLYHNFRSSTDTPLEKLHNKEWVKQHGLYSSVMDYPSINLAPADMENGYYYSPSVGTSDKWTISYGYTPDPARAARIARMGAQQGHAYGNDYDARGISALDPNTNVYDLGSDPLEWAKTRNNLVRDLWQKMPEYLLGDNTPYSDLTSAFSNTMWQYARSLIPAVKFIGGQYTFRDHHGDPDGRLPFQAVPKQKQVEAMRHLEENAFGKDAFSVSPALLVQFGGRKWIHWGTNTSFNGRKDYPFSEVVLNIQNSLLKMLIHPMRLAAIRDSELKFGQDQVLGIPELMGGLNQAIWQETWQAPGSNISTMRRNLQRAHLDLMVDILTNPPARMPADARSVTRWQLGLLRDRIDKRLTPPGFDFDDYSRAHLLESRDRIEKALEAGLEVEKGK